jgi:clan AA aspartic protease
MIGLVDSAGRALLEIEVQPAPSAAGLPIAAWIDTGFTGDLVLPKAVIDQLGLTLSGTVGAVLADGSHVAMQAYECYIQWFGDLRRLEVVGNDGTSPLLGVGLLLDREVIIDYRRKKVTLN